MKRALLAILVGSAAFGTVVGCSKTQDASNIAGTPVAPDSASASPLVGDDSDASPADIKAAKLRPCPPSSSTVPALDDGLPDLTLQCLGEGPNVRLAGVRGKPLVVNVWASWCGPCRTELPIMGDVAREMPSVEFLGVDMADSRQAALNLAGQTNMGFPSVMDPESKVRAELRIVGVPTTLFVRPDGVIAGRAAAVSSADELKALINQYLGVS